MKKIILLALITLMTCTRGTGQSMFSGSTELEVIANEWENITLSGVANGSLVSMLDCFNQKWPTWMWRDKQLPRHPFRMLLRLRPQKTHPNSRTTDH